MLVDYKLLPMLLLKHMRNLSRLFLLCIGFSFVFTSQVFAATTNVSITSTGFLPEDVTIDVGDTIIWSNEDTIDHEAMDDLVEWETGLIAPGGTGSVIFDTAGTYTYSDTVDVSLVGTVTVQAATTTSTSTTTTTSTTSSSSATTTTQPVSGVGGPTLAILMLGGALLFGGILTKKFV
jgi:plastocyanin